MNPCGAADRVQATRSLEEAFRQFAGAAEALEAGHRALAARIEALEGERLQAHGRLETVLDGIDHGVALVAPDGRLVRANRTFREMGLGATDETLWSPDLAAAIAASGTTDAAVRLRHETPRGITDLAVVIRPVHDDPDARLVSVHDVTEIRREEEEGGRRRRLEALGRVAAEVAHEVRNPLGGIRLLAAMLRDDLAGRPGEREMADQILEAVAGLEGVVANLLAFAAPGGAPRRRVDLAEIAAQAASLVAPACGHRGIRLETPSRESALLATVEPEGARQIVLNLLANALAATESGGAIEISVAPEGAGARLAVRDTGRGIAAEDLPRVFDPFFSRTEGGTGLGLSIVHAIVERHGGRIRVESRPTRGTAVSIVFPPPSEEGARHA